MNSSKSKAVFLDRDGVINRKAPEGAYIRTWREIQLIPGAVRAVASLNGAGYKVFVVTNQRGIATSKVRIEDLLDIHYRIQQDFTRGGAVISEIYHCPHDTSANCCCRKPKPGMLQRAAQEHDVDLRGSWMVGDSISDVKAGENAGCRNVLLASCTPDSTIFSQVLLLADSLQSAAPLILNSDNLETCQIRTQLPEFYRSSSREDA
jgi:D-glycero-D-manno-heptose 1,7-bisphosphate phosphatase